MDKIDVKYLNILETDIKMSGIEDKETFPKTLHNAKLISSKTD